MSSTSFLRPRLRRVDPDRVGEGAHRRRAAHEAFRVCIAGGVQDETAPGQDLLGAPEMNVGRREHRDAAVAMLVLVPGEEGPAKAVAAAWSSKRPGKPGGYFTVLKCDSENGLSSETRGRDSDRVMPRSARSCAVHLLVMGAPRSECSVSTLGRTPCFS